MTKSQTQSNWLRSIHFICHSFIVCFTFRRILPRIVERGVFPPFQKVQRILGTCFIVHNTPTNTRTRPISLGKHAPESKLQKANLLLPFKHILAVYMEQSIRVVHNEDDKQMPNSQPPRCVFCSFLICVVREYVGACPLCMLMSLECIHIPRVGEKATWKLAQHLRIFILKLRKYDFRNSCNNIATAWNLPESCSGCDNIIITFTVHIRGNSLCSSRIAQ